VTNRARQNAIYIYVEVQCVTEVDLLLRLTAECKLQLYFLYFR